MTDPHTVTRDAYNGDVLITCPKNPHVQRHDPPDAVRFRYDCRVCGETVDTRKG